MSHRAENLYQLPNIPLRGHHLDLISDIVLDKKKIYNFTENTLPEGITTENLYKYPVTGDRFVQSLVRSELKFYTGMYYGSTEDEDKLVEDYLGPKMIKRSGYEQATLAVFSDIFQSDPSRMVEVTTGPDGFCLACQSTPHGKPGMHCMDVPSVLDEQSIDALNFVIIDLNLSNSLIFEANIEKSLLLMNVTEKMTVVPVGLLRNWGFQDIYSERIQNQRK